MLTRRGSSRHGKKNINIFNNTITIDSLPVFLKSRYMDRLGMCVLYEEIMNTYKEVKYEAVEVEVAVFGLPVDQVRTPEGSERAGGGPNSRATWRNKKLKTTSDIGQYPTLVLQGGGAPLPGGEVSPGEQYPEPEQQSL